MHVDAPPEAMDMRCETFLELFTRNQDKIKAYIASLIPHRADAEDAFQRCSLLLWRKFPTWDPERSFLAWACGVSYFEVQNFIRASGQRNIHFNSELLAQLAEERLNDVEQHQERLAALSQCLQTLKMSDRELLRVAYQDGQTLKGYADSTGQLLQVLYNRLTRIRKMMLACMRRRLAWEDTRYA
ncbi:MAG TPA: sigma-70 family RNA polymerase sigma factor [Planctomicrobium sp.]|nr:sigma-70 family RNA polymerase sigma factor [Planctomicrobium sp.]